jgi:hypothetical protein
MESELKFFESLGDTHSIRGATAAQHGLRPGHPSLSLFSGPMLKSNMLF